MEDNINGSYQEGVAEENVNENQEQTNEGLLNPDDVIKVNGKEVKVGDLSKDELVAYIQKGMGADEKFQQAADTRKETEAAIDDFTSKLDEIDKMIEDLSAETDKVKEDYKDGKIDKKEAKEKLDAIRVYEEQLNKQKQIIDALNKKVDLLVGRSLQIDAEKEAKEVLDKYADYLEDDNEFANVIKIAMDKNYGLEDAMKVYLFEKMLKEKDKNNINFIPVNKEKPKVKTDTEKLLDEAFSTDF